MSPSIEASALHSQLIRRLGIEAFSPLVFVLRTFCQLFALYVRTARLIIPIINQVWARDQSTVGAGAESKAFARNVDISIADIKISPVRCGLAVEVLDGSNSCYRETLCFVTLLKEW